MDTVVLLLIVGSVLTLMCMIHRQHKSIGQIREHLFPMLGRVCVKAIGASEEAQALRHELHEARRKLHEARRKCRCTWHV